MWRSFMVFIRKNDRLVKFIALIVLMVSEADFILSTTWNPLIIPHFASLGVFIGSIGGLIAIEIATQRSEKGTEEDRALFETFIKDLPSASPTIQFLRNTNMGDMFRREYLHVLDDFVAKWQAPETFFHNRSIEQDKRELIHSITSFLEQTRRHTYYEGEQMQRVDISLRHTDEERWKIIVNELNSLADIIANKHEAFIENARRILAT